MSINTDLLTTMTYNLDRRAAQIRACVYERMAQKGVVQSPDHIVGTFFVVSQANDLCKVGEEISYHMTSGVHHPPAGSLLDECTGKVLAVDAFDATNRVGLVWVGFPVKMMQYDDGTIYSTDILHLMAGEGVVGLCDHQDIQLAHLEFPASVIQQFPGPAYGAEGIREAANFPAGVPMFGTILKPCSGITPQEVGDLVRGVAGNPVFGFAKEDENLIPGVPFCPLAERAKEAAAAIREQASKRNGRGLFYAPHITSPADRILQYVDAALDAGLNALMFSDQFMGGATRLVREYTKNMTTPPAIYAHNSGISNKTRSIWREVLDLLVRLDGGDFRQTAPLTTAAPLLRPNGQEWVKCEEALTKPLGHIKPVMIARAGGLDQGNIILNLHDAQQRGYGDGVLYLAGSAINSIKDATGKPSTEVGSEAMLQAVEAYTTGAVAGDTGEGHVEELLAYAKAQNKTALVMALKQRYGHLRD